MEYFAKQEYLESKKVKFESEEEKEYYDFIVDLMEEPVELCTDSAAALVEPGPQAV